MPPHVRRGGTRGRSNTPRHPAQARAGLSAGRSAPRTQGKFAAFDEFCKRLFQQGPYRFHNKAGFMKALCSEVIDISPNAVVYLREAVAAFYMDCLLSISYCSVLQPKANS